MPGISVLLTALLVAVFGVKSGTMMRTCEWMWREDMTANFFKKMNPGEHHNTPGSVSCVAKHLNEYEENCCYVLTSLSTGTALHCVQCSNCPDTETIPSAKNCTRNTFFDEFTKMVPGGTTSGNTGGRPVSCFKMIVNLNNKETVSRGCSGEINQYECTKIVDGVEVCACVGDGCNSASIPVVPVAVITASLLLTFASIY